MQTLPPEWMDGILAPDRPPLPGRGLAEADGAIFPLGADSSGAETTRYEQVERPDKDARDCTKKPQKVYWKYHITAVPGLQIILTAIATSCSLNDTNVLVHMLAEIQGAAGSTSQTAYPTPVDGTMPSMVPG